MASGPLWLSEADVEALVDPLALIAAVEAGFLAAESGTIREPGSTRLDGLDGGDAYMTLYPAHETSGLASAKLLAGRPANAAEGHPEIDAIVALVEPGSGRIVALIAARELTALRTAAVTAAMLKRLMRDAPARIALVGTGAQARAHGRMLAAAGIANAFAIASPRGDAGRAKAAAQAIAGLTGMPAEPRPLQGIARDCGALVLMTLAESPLELGPLARDCVIAGIGPFYPHAQELDPAIVASAALVVSDQPARLCRQWWGSSLLDVEALPLASSADLIAGKVALPPEGRHIFLSDGRAFEDNVAAALIYRAARAAGRGLALP